MPYLSAIQPRVNPIGANLLPQSSSSFVHPPILSQRLQPQPSRRTTTRTIGEAETHGRRKQRDAFSKCPNCSPGGTPEYRHAINPKDIVLDFRPPAGVGDFWCQQHGGVRTINPVFPEVLSPVQRSDATTFTYDFCSPLPPNRNRSLSSTIAPGPRQQDWDSPCLLRVS